MDIYILLIIAHLVGTIIGVGGATMVEVAVSRALKDGTMSPDERSILGPAYTTVRVGLVIALLSGFGLVLLYKITGETARLYDPVLWAKFVVILIIALNALLLQMHKVSVYWGSSLSFVSWWLAAILGVFLSNGVHTSFWAIISTYVLALVVGAAALHYFRRLITK